MLTGCSQVCLVVNLNCLWILNNLFIKNDILIRPKVMDISYVAHLVKFWSWIFLLLHIWLNFKLL